ncbi:MAG: hypothetical protein GYB67_04890 [Chloroflexi bacterium]|nr:hypothetical protein [Chloroflexota bacterium]
MRKFVWLLLIVGVLGAGSVGAQDGAASAGCVIDLGPARALLLEAQSAARTGQIDDALTLVEQTQATLTAITDGCAAARALDGIVGGTGPRARSVDLGNFVTPDGAFSLDLPANWVPGSFISGFEGGTLYIGASGGAAIALEEPNPELFPGEQAIALFVGSSESMAGGLSGDAGLSTIITALAGNAQQLYADVVPTEFFTLGERTAARFSFAGPSFDAHIVAVQLPEQDRFVVATGLASPGELDDSLIALTASVAASVR